MEVFVLHILKLNIIAAVVILLVKVLASFAKRYSLSQVEICYLADRGSQP